jgi:hypothetical protein
LGHDHVPSGDEIPLLSILSSEIYQVDALLATPKAKEFVQTLVAMDTCCGLDLIREDMVPKDLSSSMLPTPRVYVMRMDASLIYQLQSLWKCRTLIKFSK